MRTRKLPGSAVHPTSIAMLVILAAVSSTAALGTAGAVCAAGENGPSIRLIVAGLKDRSGSLVAEIYPDNDADFLKDDNLLVSQGKLFRRVTGPVPSSGPVSLCIRVPAPGHYAVAVTHKRDGKRSFNFWSDGIGFAGNPRLGFSKPHADAASVTVGAGPVSTRIVMNYKDGLFSFGPLHTGN